VGHIHKKKIIIKRGSLFKKLKATVLQGYLGYEKLHTPSIRVKRTVAKHITCQKHSFHCNNDPNRLSIIYLILLVRQCM